MSSADYARRLRPGTRRRSPRRVRVGLLRKVFAYGFGYAPRRAFVPAGRTGPLGEHEDLQRFRRMSALIPPMPPTT